MATDLKLVWGKVRPYRYLLLATVFAFAASVWLGQDWLLGTRVSTITVTQRELVRTIVATGRVVSPHRVGVGTQIVGTVARVPVAEGQTVSADQALIELENAELRAAVSQADATVMQAKARLRQLREATVPVADEARRQAEVTADSARTQLKRQQDLFKQGFIGQAVLDDARKAVDLAEAQLRSASEQLKSFQPTGSDSALAQAALAQAEASAEAARARLRYAVVRAPSAGVLISRDVEPGDAVQPGKTLMTLSPSGETQLVVLIDEKNLAALAVGQRALASADAFADRRFPTELVYINPGVDPQRGSVEVKLRVPNPPDYLRQDMTVSVDIEVARRVGAVLVPTHALREVSGGKPWVLVAEAGHARKRAVELGMISNGVTEVKRGLSPGEEVIPVASPINEGSRLRVARGSLR
ncbi:MAG: efflux RND transporter periplasmic adaptor subunit [Rhodocyclaceae bacterium]|nr:efflux RND transporter periplasmic adaptor subunit [Rhodocyclaceae bacterium]